MGTIQPRCNDSGDEELGAVGILASVGHGKKTRLGVLKLEVLVYDINRSVTIALYILISLRTCEFLSVDGLSASAVVLGEVTTLKHE